MPRLQDTVRSWSSAGSMVIQRLRRRPSNEPALGRRHASKDPALFPQCDRFYIVSDFLKFKDPGHFSSIFANIITTCTMIMN